jgi:HD-GYP domain-containing protein (c-di-GMP phosphodiesterase class II)
MLAAIALATSLIAVPQIASAQASAPAAEASAAPAAVSALFIGLALFGLLAARALRTFLLTRRVADLVVAIGIVWLASALPPAMLLSFMQLGWWMGHGFELLGIVVVAVPVALDLRRSAQSRPLVGDVCGADLVQAEEAFLGSHVRALTLSLARKDEYTEEHTRRVALRAVQVGEVLGLTGGRLRGSTHGSSRCATCTTR